MGKTPEEVLQDLVNETVKRMRKAERMAAEYRTMTLGELIAAFEKMDPQTEVTFDIGGAVPTHLMSYRGYYDELALGFTTEPKNPATVESLLAELRGAVGEVFTGYKGGDFEMGLETPVWADNYGHASSLMIVEVAEFGYMITKKIE